MSGTADRARSAVAQAVRGGRIAEPTNCIVCGCPQGRTDAGLPVLVLHHSRGYEGDAALDVVALCRRDHGRVHAGSIPDPVTGDRRRPDHYRISGEVVRLRATARALLPAATALFAARTSRAVTRADWVAINALAMELAEKELGGWAPRRGADGRWGASERLCAVLVREMP